MKAVVVYESLWGNTAAVARAIAEGIGNGAQALSTAEATPELLAGTDLIVAGAPVLAFHMSSDRIRADIAARPEPGAPPPDLSHPSLQSWLETLAPGTAICAAFDTEVRGPFGTIAVYDVAAIRATAEILVGADASGHRMGLTDAQIAGICVVSGPGLATRNVRDFDRVALLNIVNPFD